MKQLAVNQRKERNYLAAVVVDKLQKTTIHRFKGHINNNINIFSKVFKEVRKKK